MYESQSAGRTYSYMNVPPETRDRRKSRLVHEFLSFVSSGPYTRCPRDATGVTIGVLVYEGMDRRRTSAASTGLWSAVFTGAGH